MAVRIDQGRFILQMAERESHRAIITVENPTQREVTVEVYLEDFIYIDPYDGSKSFFSPGSRNTSLSEWVTFSPRQFTLPAYGRRKVTLSVRPNQSFDTTHSGVIFFETPVGEVGQEGAGISLKTRVGSLIFVEPKIKKKEAVFSQIEGGRNQLKGKFVNSGNSLITADGTFYLLDRQGMLKERGSLQSLYMLPGDQTSLSLPLPDGLPSGDYTMVVNFDLKEGEVLVKEIDFSLQPSGRISILGVKD